MRDNNLKWPLELASHHNDFQFKWAHPDSNLCLDFHGDAINAKLVVFSDGNHHMALHEAIKIFLNLHPNTIDVFYATTPPGVLLDFLKHKRMLLGNLTLSVTPNVFISPGNIISTLQQQETCTKNQAFMKSRGNVLLVHKGNPKNITTIEDLLRENVRLFISNPETEKSSFEIYQQTLMAAIESKSDGDTKTNLLSRLEQTLSLDSTTTHFGSCIHHRELPQALANNQADVAVVYYHLALRYTRIFPDLFDIVELLALDSPDNPVTEYGIAVLNEPGEFGELFYDYMLSPEVRTIYQKHGLTTV